MRSTVVYASRHGCTRQIAEVIAGALHARGEVLVLQMEQAPAIVPVGTDLLVVGGPTEGHGMTPAVARYLDRIGSTGIEGLTAAAFDTRLRWPSWLAGSAAADIARTLRRQGARVVGPEGSFFVSMRPELVPGELARAAKWAASLAERVEASAREVATV